MFRNLLGFFKEAAKLLSISLLVMIVTKFFLFEPFLVEGSSMLPSFNMRDVVLVHKNLSEIQRGDVVIVKGEFDEDYLFKRIIGLPGETLTLTNGEVRITKDNSQKSFLVEEPYVKHVFTNGQDDKTVILKNTQDSQEYFVMGDNRAESFDSRSFGPVEKQTIKGKFLISAKNLF